MVLRKNPKAFRKKLEVSFDIPSSELKIDKIRTTITQKTSIEVDIDTSIPLPSVYAPLSPTKYKTQTIRGRRHSDDYQIYVVGTENSVSYNEKEFSVTVNLDEGINSFEIRTLISGISSNPVYVTIERDSVPPKTKLLANNTYVPTRKVTSGSFDITFKTDESHKPTTTYYKINDNFVNVFSDQIFLYEERPYTIAFWSEDSIGNIESKKTVSLIIDRTPPNAPEIDVSRLPLKTNLSNIGIYGTQSPDSVRVEINGQSATLLDNTNWAIIFQLTIEGPNAIKAVAFDEANNASIPAETSIIRDQTPPKKPTIITRTRRTRSSAIRLIGGHSIDTYKMLLNDVEGQVILSSPIRWYVDLSLIEGPNIFNFKAVDDVGNISQSLDVTIELDTIPPPPPFVDPVISPTNQLDIVLTGTVSLDTATIVINNSSNRTSINNGRWVALVTLDRENLNQLDVQSEDDLGNRSIPTSVFIIRDLVPPKTPTIDGIPLFVGVSNRTLSGSKSIDTTEIVINGDSSGVTYPSATRWSKNIILNIGLNSFEVRAKDYVGNISSAASALTTYKPHPPTFLIDPYILATLADTVRISGTREQDSIILINNTNTGVIYPDGIYGGTRWGATLFLFPGTNRFKLKAVDLAVNESPEQEISIERILPENIGKFSINTVYAFGQDNKKRIFVDGEIAPLITSRLIRSYFVTGIKPEKAKVVSSAGTIEYPDGEIGTTWRAILPLDKLVSSPIHLTIDTVKVLRPPEIIISHLVAITNIFGGKLFIKIGGNVDVTMEQNSSIVITDYQLKNTPSPFVGIPLSLIITSEPI